MKWTKNEIQKIVDEIQEDNPAGLIEAIQIAFHFGTCDKGHASYIFNVWRDQWMACDICKVKWLIGTNLFSSWRSETQADWDANIERHKDYKEIEPAGWYPARQLAENPDGQLTEEWSCEICAYRYNCPRPFDEYLDEERGCEYYLPDDEEITRINDEEAEKRCL